MKVVTLMVPLCDNYWDVVELSKQAVFEFEEAPGKITKSGSVDGAGRVRHMVAPGGYV